MKPESKESRETREVALFIPIRPSATRVRVRSVSCPELAARALLAHLRGQRRGEGRAHRARGALEHVAGKGPLVEDARQRRVRRSVAHGKEVVPAVDGLCGRRRRREQRELVKRVPPAAGDAHEAAGVQQVDVVAARAQVGHEAP